MVTVLYTIITGIAFKIFKVDLRKQIAARPISMWIAYGLIGILFLSLPVAIPGIVIDRWPYIVTVLFLLLVMYYFFIKSFEKALISTYEDKAPILFVIKGSAKFSVWGAIPFFEEIERVVHFTLLYMITDNVYISLVLTALIFAVQHSNWAEMLNQGALQNFISYFVISCLMTAFMYLFGYLIAFIIHAIQNIMPNINTKRMKKVYYAMLERELPHYIVLQTGEGIERIDRFIEK